MADPLRTQLSPELGLLVACTQVVNLDEAYAAKIRQTIEATPPDWQRMGSIALRHKMVGVLNRYLQHLSSDVDPQAVSTLAALSRRSAVHTLSRLEHLKQIVRELEGAGIPVVPYKGIALGQQIYDNHALRPPGDIDIVVRPRDSRRAKQLLLEMGYRLSYPVAQDEQEFRLENRYCEEFEADNNVFVELHWAFTNRAIRFSIDVDELLERLGSVEVGGMQMRAFAPEDLLLILSVHGAKHHWECLEYIFQIAEIVRRFDLDWQTVLDRAHQTGARRKLFLALRIAHELLEAPLPEHVHRLVFKDERVARMAALVPGYLENPLEVDDESGSSESDLFHFNLQDSALDRARYVFHRITTPSRPEDWNVKRVGRFLLPVHAFVRPFQLMGRLVPAVWSHIKPGRASNGKQLDDAATKAAFADQNAAA